MEPLDDICDKSSIMFCFKSKLNVFDSKSLTNLPSDSSLSLISSA